MKEFHVGDSEDRTQDLTYDREAFFAGLNLKTMATF